MVTKNPILFLDHDGVMAINSKPEKYAIPFFNEWNAPPFDIKAVITLNRIINDTGCDIVVSSDWRHEYSLEVLGDIYEANGISRRPFSVTDYVPGRATDPGLALAREKEIELWLAKYRFTGKFAIIDDLPMYEGREEKFNFFRTTWREGIKKSSLADKVIKALT